jgi:protein-disulfide isomerase
MTKKTWLIFGALCIALIGGLIFISRQSKIDVSNVNLSQVQAASDKNGNIGDHTFGNMKSKVILVEYGDYQCPGCGSAYPVIKEVTEKYKDKIGFIFRNFPLSTIHPNALAAASAAEVAGLNGKFWEMHDQLYSTQSSWESLGGSDRTTYFKQLGTSLGIDASKFSDEALGASNIQAKIRFDQALGNKAGVSGTPGLFIGTKDVGNQYFVGNNIVTKGTSGAELVWSSASSFEKFVIEPALKEAGISTDAK